MELAKHNQQSTLLTSLLTKEELTQTTSFQQLTALEKDIAIACLEPKIRDMDFNVFLTGMLGLIGKTYLNCGYDLAKSKDQIDLTVDELCRDLQKYNGLLSFQEIQIAFANGYKQVYGEFYGLNNATYFVWVNAYTFNQHRINAKKAIEDSKNKPVVKPEPSEEEKEKIIKDGALKKFDDYKASGNLSDPGNTTYRFLERMELLVLTKEKKLEYMEQASGEIREEAIQNRGAKPLNHVLGESLTEDRVKTRAKRIALKKYFDQLIEMEINLQDEL